MLKFSLDLVFLPRLLRSSSVLAGCRGVTKVHAGFDPHAIEKDPSFFPFCFSSGFCLDGSFHTCFFPLLLQFRLLFGWIISHVR
ncbi:hypothetical protein SEVIR_3G067732v4 [Setaria viridis]|uniref:Secreted protein n=1 Tax=Setaria viridis TaxID=4556 RepID=A0A4U6V9A8_SETVI|nr:hypothetical protein SEVIR_3G067732v2 [Setaria viridis]